MARYTITVEQDRLREASIQKLVADLKSSGASVTIQKEERPTSRAERLSSVLDDLESALEDAKSEVESLRDEIEEWKGGMEGTNLENTEKYQTLSDCYDALEDMLSRLEDIEIPDAGDIEFPGMY